MLGYARGLISSRKIEQACQENVVFIALACGQQPDHSTMATFVSSMQNEVLPLFRDVLWVCQEMDFLGGTFFALDGVKLPSNASKEWSGTRSEMQRKKERLEAKVQQLLEEHVQGGIEKTTAAQGQMVQTARTGKSRLSALQKQAERIDKWLQGNAAKYGTTGNEISSNLKDNESAKMKTAHGVIQGYNSQALIDGKRQVIVHAQAFGRGQDHAHAPPMLEELWKIFRAWGMVQRTLLEKSSPPTPTITATPICGDAKSYSWMPISLTGFSADETPAMPPNVGIGLGGSGLP